MAVGREREAIYKIDQQVDRSVHVRRIERSDPAARRPTATAHREFRIEREMNRFVLGIRQQVCDRVANGAVPDLGVEEEQHSARLPPSYVI